MYMSHSHNTHFFFDQCNAGIWGIVGEETLENDNGLRLGKNKKAISFTADRFNLQ